MSLTATIFYDIPQLNLGLVLHQHKDIRILDAADNDDDDDEDPDSETRSIKDAMKKYLFAPSSAALRRSGSSAKDAAAAAAAATGDMEQANDNIPSKSLPSDEGEGKK